MAFALLAVSLFCWLPIFATLYYDGFRSVFEWPPLFQWFLVLGLLLVGLALQLVFSKQRVGAEVHFHQGGFTLTVRHFFRRRWEHKVDWTDIEEMKLVEAPRGGDVLAFRLTYDASIREGVIQPTTRADAAKVLVGREISLPLKLTVVSIKEAVARFTASAEQAGATLVETSSFNVVVFVRKVWAVEWR